MGQQISIDSEFERTWYVPSNLSNDIVIPYEGRLTRSMRRAIAERVAKEFKLSGLAAEKFIGDCEEAGLPGWKADRFRVRSTAKDGRTSFASSSGGGFCHLTILPQLFPEEI